MHETGAKDLAAIQVPEPLMKPYDSSKSFPFFCKKKYGPSIIPDSNLLSSPFSFPTLHVRLMAQSGIQHTQIVKALLCSLFWGERRPTPLFQRRSNSRAGSGHHMDGE